MREEGKRIKSQFRKALKENRKEVYMVFAGLVFLVFSVPIFLLVSLSPTINSEIGPSQVSSWTSVTFSFIGFGLIVYGMGKLNK